jgi:hypothetical protein
VPSWKKTLFSAALEADDYSWMMSEVESPVSEAMTMFLCKWVVIMRGQSLWTKRLADAEEMGCAPPLFEFHEQLQKGSAKRCC